MVDVANVKKRVIKDATWYLKYRTQIWGAIFLVIGLVGGNSDRIKSWIPTLKYDTPTLEKKLQTLENVSNQLEEIKKELDKLRAE